MGVDVALFMDLRMTALHRFLSRFLLGSATLVRSLSGSIICSWNVLGYRTRIDVPEVVYFSGEHVQYTLTGLQTLNAT